MESFLKEQLKRIQDLAKQLSSLETHAAELSHERERERAALSYGPLSDVRDLRTYTTGRDHQTVREHHTREPRSTADDRSRSRRRRRRS